MSRSQSPAGRPWPAVLLTIAALAWLLAVIGIGVGSLGSISALTAPQLVVAIGALVLEALPALAVAILALAWVARTRPATAAALAAIDARQIDARIASDALATDVVALDDMLERIAERFAHLREAVARDAVALDANSARFETGALQLAQAAGLARGASDTLETILPGAAMRVAELQSALETTAAETHRQLAEVETSLAAVWSASDDATARHDGAADAATARLAALRDAADGVVERVAGQAAELQRVVAAAFDGTAAALDRTREGVAMHNAALTVSVEKARTAIDHIGDEAGHAVGARLAQVLAAATALGDSLAAQDAQSQAFADGATRSFRVLDARLTNAATTTGATLDGLAARLDGVHQAIDGLGGPLGSADRAVGDLESAMGRLATAGAAAVVSLGTDLPATHDGVAALATGVAALQRDLDALAAPVGASDATVARIAAGLGASLDTAREVETTTGTAALVATSQLIEVLGRVREVAAATAGTMRTTLDGVVAEAEAALAEAGTRRARSAFGDPVAVEIEALRLASDAAAAAAQRAAERVTQRLMSLTATIATVESRIDEVDTRYDVALRDDLARRSEALLASLQSGAIDVVGLLGIDVGDAAWGDYLKGDRGVFARRAVRLLDRDTARKIQRHFQHDVPFREQATRYIVEFETLLQRVMPDREGKALAVTLLSSDIGKLYVVLAQATERLR